MDETEFVSEEEETPEPQKWSWVNFWAATFNGVAVLGKIAGAVLDDYANLMRSHVAFRAQEKDFEKRASLEIEALTREPVPEGAKVGG